MIYTIPSIVAVIAMAVLCMYHTNMSTKYSAAYEREKARADTEKGRADCISELLVGRITKVENAFLEAGFNAEKGTGNDKA